MKNNNPKRTTIEILFEADGGVIQAIANRHEGIADKVYRGLHHTIQRAKSSGGYFGVVLRNEVGEVIGFAHFIQSGEQPTQWLYTDLWVAPEQRRRGNAKRIVRAGCEHLLQMGAKTLLCTVDPENLPSLKTQEALGFGEIENRPFAFFETEGLLMFKKEL